MQVQEKVINGFRLSPQQKWLWKLQPDNPTYRVQFVIRVEGLLQVNSLKAALQQVCDRHEILRTTFQRPAGIKTPLQVIAESSAFDWQVIDLQGYDAEQQVQQLETLFQQEQRTPFNWQHAPLRASLLILSQKQHVLLLSLPALCADNWSIPLIVQALCQSYEHCLKGAESEDEVVQYIQFAEWQNQLLEEDAEGQSYWQQLELCPLTTLRLPFEKVQTKQPEFTIASLQWQLPPELVAKITAIAQATDTSSASFLLACWQILLPRFVESDFVIGVGVNGRKYEELESAIGLLAQYLPLPCAATENLSFEELLQQIHTSVQKAEEWQEYFTWDYWTNTRSSVKTPKLPFSFDFQQLSTQFSADGISFTIDKQFACLDQFKLRLSCTQNEETLVLSFDYDANLFHIEEIDRFIEYFQTLVANAIADPKTLVAQLEILSDRARHQLLVEFNQTQTDFPKDQCIHQLFEAQAERTPNQIALVFEDQQLTYAELNARANQLAHYLQSLGAVPEKLVGIYLERSLETIVSLLGILKAGVAYLPLDAALPPEALASRIEDAQPIALLTQEKLLNSVQLVSEGASPHVVCLDQDWSEIAQHSPLNPCNRAAPENLIYAIYTSGSTGHPKGVAVEHRNLLNYLYGILEKLPVSAGSSFATVSTLAADLGNTVIFPALCTGGCLHVISSDRRSDPEALAEYCQRHLIDYLKIVPSHLEALLTSSQFAAILPRQCLILGGEAVSWKLIQTVQQYAPNCQILNHYGPTEATVGVLTYAVPQVKDEPESTIVPLGRPIANTQIYILDSHQQPVPIGVKGELYIEGDSLARGYLNRPELTEEKFIPNPFSSQSEARLYRTGDFARYKSDGTIEFLGRADNQVKIRGYRIELGEIEAVLRQSASIKQAIVIQAQDATSNKRLIAYVVTHPGCTANATELRHFAQQKLPEYMVPPAFVFLKSLPLTANGKIDYQALPSPNQELDNTASFVAPRTPLEAVLADIWSDLLGVNLIGIHDSFFDLGGHSLLMTQLLVRVREAFQVDIPLSHLFVTPTIAGLAEQIERSRSGKNGEIPQVDLVAEAVLDPAIYPASPFPGCITKPARIFLTGATGFLGAFLLRELLEQTSADVYCLVRAADTESAQKKLQKNLQTYAIWQESFAERIIPVPGELAQPLLGLSKLQFQELANQIDVIYHNGALVNFTFPYAALKPANVLGTQEVLRLASQVKVKPVNFISTTNAVSPKQGTGVRVMYETDFLHPNDVIETGYAQSKWVAEQLVLQAGNRGLPVCIYRPGRVAWDSRTGIGSTSDNTFRMIKGCIQLGIVPQRDTMVNLIPVDFASQAIVQISQQENSFGKTFHLVNPNPASWSQVIDWVRLLGYDLQKIPDQQWREQLREAASSDPNHALHSLVPFLTQADDQASTADTLSLQFDCQNTLDSLSSLKCPPVNAELVCSYFSYLTTQGRLEAPTAANNSNYSLKG